MIRVDPNRCPQNHRCPAVVVCPMNALSQDGHKLPRVSVGRCIECLQCIRLCPMGALYQTVD